VEFYDQTYCNLMLNCLLCAGVQKTLKGIQLSEKSKHYK